MYKYSHVLVHNEGALFFRYFLNILRGILLVKKKRNKLYFSFLDLEKAFDRVMREEIRWAMHKL